MMGFGDTFWFFCGLALSRAERITIEAVQSTDATNGLAYRVVSESGPIGDDGTIRGAGGKGRLESAKAAGADSMRTWGMEDLPKVVPDAEDLGLKISAGIWLTHDAHYYEDCSDMDADPFWQKFLNETLREVRRFKNSSAILWWTVGNEVELQVAVTTGTDCLWSRMDWFAKAVKAEDPNHPVGTVLAGAHLPKLRNIVRICEEFDFLGINTYGKSSLSVGENIREAGWTKAYAIMEFGPTGHWDANQTVWGSYIEESSSQKAPRYLATCHSCKDDPQCVGAFAFVWGWKWEKTGTWYGMFNEWPAVTEGVAVNCSGCESETVAIMEECWTHQPRANPAPRLVDVHVGKRRLPGMRFTVGTDLLVPLRVEATHALDHNLTALWAITEEVVSNAIGGAFEATNPLVSGLWQGTSEDLALGLDVVLNTSGLPVGHAYRLYVFVREDPEHLNGRPFPQHEASATLPFLICHTAVYGEACYWKVNYAMEVGIRADPGAYPGVAANSSFEEVQMLLHQQGKGSCGIPCGGYEEWCYTSREGEQCYGHVEWILQEGVYRHPEMFEGIKNTSSIEAVQTWLHEKGHAGCPRACAGSSEPVSEGEKETRKIIHMDVKPQDDGASPTSSASAGCATQIAYGILGVLLTIVVKV